MPRPSLSIISQHYAPSMSRQSSTSSTTSTTSSLTNTSSTTPKTLPTLAIPSTFSSLPARNRTSTISTHSGTLSLEALSLNDLLTLDPTYDSSLSVSEGISSYDSHDDEALPAYELKEEFPPDCQFEVVEITGSDVDEDEDEMKTSSRGGEVRFSTTVVERSEKNSKWFGRRKHGEGCSCSKCGVKRKGGKEAGMTRRYGAVIVS